MTTLLLRLVSSVPKWLSEADHNKIEIKVCTTFYHVLQRKDSDREYNLIHNMRGEANDTSSRSPCYCYMVSCQLISKCLYVVYIYMHGLTGVKLYIRVFNKFNFRVIKSGYFCFIVYFKLQITTNCLNV